MRANVPPAILNGGALPASVWVPSSVTEILDRACDTGSGGVTYHRADGTEVATSYRDLRDAAVRAEGSAQLVLSDPDVFLPRLWGCFLRGEVPVIAPRPMPSLQVPDCGGDTALLIFTSGTTGEPKLVPLTHRNIAACVAAAAYVNGYGAGDVSLNWLPLCHIGGLMRSIRDVYLGCRQVQVATEVVREDPLRWLDLIDAHRATVTWGPNAAFAAVVAQRHELPSRRAWSLGCLRSVCSAGEAVAPQTMRAFTEMLEPSGFRADSLRAGWGMTEACSATWSDSLEDVGTPVPGVSLRIVDEHEETVGEGETGHLLVSTGGDWIHTGDLGRIAGGRLSITGRIKDVIKLGGISFANREIEEAAGGDAVACGVETSEGEALAIFADVDEARVPEMRVRVASALGITARFVIPIRSGELPRTPLGKIQRGRLREAFAAGAYERFRRWPYDLRAVPPPAGGAVTAAERERAARIAEIISDVLRVPVGLHDDFFALGGTSLRVAQAATRIGCALVDLFCAPTPLSLARRLMRWSGGLQAAGGRKPAAPRDAVAIVGMACRFPGAPDVDAFWRLLSEGRDPLTEFSAEELIAAGIDRRVVDDPAYVRAGMVLDDVETFDAEFFGIPARDAEIMDPQQRLLLECAWHAFEDAGHPPSSSARVGIYVGGRVSEYMQFHQPPLDLFGSREPPADGFRRLVVNDKDYLATRLAFALDTRGPAISVQTACSTSLVAVHMACRSLLDGECDFALAGGASIRVPQKAGYIHTEGMIFSPDGRTRPFDAAAGGTLFGSGVGVVVLRRLADAIAGGDRIYAVVRGSAVNNDGAGPKPAFTAPSHAGQAAVIAEALAAADIDPATVSYVEAHGTGTAVGDPIEIAALDEVFRRAGARTGSCAVGSVKSNVGHLVQAAGVASLMKTALMLRHRTLVPSVNFSKPNPLIDFASSPFFVNTERRAWESGGAPLRAGVSAFGFGGTNAHAVVEEAPAAAAAAAESDRPRILPLSAKSPAALRQLAAAYAGLSGSLRDICASAQNGRTHLPYRAAVVASSIEELREKLGGLESPPHMERPRIAFVFSGQGTQYAGMGRRLYETHPTFRRTIDELAMGEALFDRDLERTEFAQPALVALQAGLVAVWRERGIEPDVVLGHSLGEITAAWAAGILTLGDALRFAEARGRLMQRAAPGAMAAVFAPPDALATRGYDVAIAALNGPQQTVISGAANAVEDVLADLRKRGIATRRLPGGSAFHSPLMDTILDELRDAAAQMTVSPPQRPVISTLTGAAAEGDFAQPAYWRRQARETVQYSRAFAEANADVVVQIGPGQDDPARMLETLADLYVRGVDVDWRRVETEPWQRVALPSYPFQRKRFWLTERHQREYLPASDDHPLLGRRIPSPLPEVQFQSELTADVAPFARDHWVYGVRPLVMVGQLEMMRAAVGESSVAVENVVVEQALLLSDEMRRVQTLLDPDGGVRIFSSADGRSWDLHSSARARSASAAVRYIDIAAIRARCRQEMSKDAVYARKEAKGAAIAGGVKLVNRAWRGDGEVIAEVELDQEAVEFAPRYGAYPGVLDSIAQCGELTLADGDPLHARLLFLPTVLERFVFHDRLPERVWTTLRRRGDATGDVYGIDGEVADDSGRVLLSIEGLYFKRATAASLTRAELSYEIEWVPLAPAARAVEEGRRVAAGKDDAAEGLCARALDAAQAMLADNDDGPLWLITRGGQATGGETAPLAPAHAALWGFGRAVQREQPSLRCRLIDLDPARSGDDDDLQRAMAQGADEVVVRGGVLHARRMRPARPPARIEGPYALRAGSERTLEGLAVVPAPRREPGAGEVEIELFATGLNFRDVLTATGRIDGPLGYECSGVIARCGAGVTRFAPGDAVMAVALNTFASHVVVDERLVVPKPSNLSFAAAATSIVAYLTTMHALLERARLRAGERLLVHTAAGGVGHAAVHVARLAGAEVVATASRGKWPLVRALGVERVFDSRTPGYSRGMEAVDVVLNTLGAEFNADNLAVLRPGGRLIDLGHPQVLDLQAMAAQAAAVGVEFINFHIAQDVGIADPDHMRELLTTLAGHLASGRLPALPCRAFALSEVRQAFETMLRGAHVGKLAIVHPAAERAETSISADATYLITGGAGAVGTRIAEWLVERGARHLVLLSRNAAPREAAEGVEIRALQADVAGESSLRAALAAIADMPPLRGIIHAAGVIDDGILPQQTHARFANVLSPKVAGAWNLHRLTESMPLDFFVLVSSVAGLWGNAGQTNYAAANAFLDQLAHFRRQRGLNATSIDYGAWRGAGMAAAIPDAVRQRRAESGASELEPEQAVRALELALAKDRAQVAVFAGTSPLLAPPAQERRTESAAAEKGVAPRSLDDALERTRRVVAALCGWANIDVARPLPELGLDSLTVLLLRGRLIAEFGNAAALPVIRFLEGRSVAELAAMTHERAMAAAAPPPERRWTSLTAMKAAGSRPPIFLVPPAARTAMTFNRFAQAVDGGHPVYGLNPLGLDGRTEPHASVDEMASHYIDEIRSLQPDGPYILGGMCFGGHVAWEMARRLTESGCQVPLLILFDASPPLAQRFERSIRDVSAHVVRFYTRRVLHHLRHRSLVRALARRVRVTLHGSSPLEGDGWQPDAEVSETMRRVIDAHAAASLRYRARTFGGDVLLLESEEFHDYLFHDRWRHLMKGRLETVRFAGTSHLEILQETHAAALARAVTERLAALK